MTGRMFIADAENPDGEWTEVGHLADGPGWFDTLGPYDVVEPGAFDALAQPEPIRHHATFATFTEPVTTTDGLESFIGLDVSRDGHAAMTFTQVAQVPDLPPAPRKRRRLTGKAYRAARRRHRRARQAWERAGRPHHREERVTYLPSVRVNGIEKVAGDPGAYSIGCQLVSARQ